MPSQTDLDQGGTIREWVSRYLGPSVGWVRCPGTNFLAGTNNITTITVAGTYSLDLSTNVVQVAVNGAVVIILPSALITPPAITQPGLHVRASVTILDAGGVAQAFPITIKPISIAENIMGLTQIQITSNYGGFTLQPVSRISGWVNVQ